MSDLVAILYPTEAQAEAMRDKLLKLQQDYLIDLGDAVVVEKTLDGKIKLHQLINTTAAGAASGSFWGLLIGLVFMIPIVGVVVGAASGAIGGALNDFGINDDFMRRVAAGIQPGNAALFVLIKKLTTDKVLEAIEGSGGTVLQTSLDHTKEQALRDALAASAAPAEVKENA